MFLRRAARTGSFKDWDTLEISNPVKREIYTVKGQYNGTSYYKFSFQLLGSKKRAWSGNNHRNWKLY